MTSEKIIDILKNGKIHLSCELFPPKQGAELQNSLEIVNKIAASKPSTPRALEVSLQGADMTGIAKRKENLYSKA